MKSNLTIIREHLEAINERSGAELVVEQRPIFGDQFYVVSELNVPLLEIAVEGIDMLTAMAAIYEAAADFGL